MSENDPQIPLEQRDRQKTITQDLLQAKECEYCNSISIIYAQQACQKDCEQNIEEAL